MNKMNHIFHEMSFASDIPELVKDAERKPNPQFLPQGKWKLIEDVGYMICVDYLIYSAYLPLIHVKNGTGNFYYF